MGILNQLNFMLFSRKKFGNWLNLILIFFIIQFLTACNFFTQSGSIEDWYQSEKRKVVSNPNKVIIPVKPVTVVSFRGGETGDPFDMRNLIKEVEEEEEGPDKNAPDFDRLRQPLESYPLSSMQFVGTILQPAINQDIALVSAAGSLYQVRKGEYLGQDYGLVVDIKETEIVLEERIKNAANNRWQKKERVISLVGLSKETLR